MKRTRHLATSMHATGWRSPIGCLKLQVIFRKRATNYRVLLQKTTYKDKASYESSPLVIHSANLVGACICVMEKRREDKQSEPTHHENTCYSERKYICMCLYLGVEGEKGG